MEALLKLSFIEELNMTVWFWTQEFVFSVKNLISFVNFFKMMNCFCRVIDC